MAKQYLKKGDRVFTTGAYLLWDGKKWIVDGIEDDTFYDGELVNFDSNERPYICPKVCHKKCNKYK